MVVFNLYTFPDVCRLCLQSKRPDELVSVDVQRPLYDGTLSNLLEELTFKIPTHVSRFFPSEVCSTCLETFEVFYKYKQKMNYIHHFLVAFIEVKLGNDRPLVKLFSENNDYFSILFKDLDLCNKDELLVEDLLEEFPEYMIASLPSIVKQEPTGEAESEVEEAEDYEIQIEFLEEKEKEPNDFLVERLLEELQGEAKGCGSDGKLLDIKAEPVRLLPVVLDGSEMGVEVVPYDESEYLDNFQDDEIEAVANEEGTEILSLDKIEAENDSISALNVVVEKISFNCTKCKFKTQFKEAFASHQRRHEQNDHLEGIHCSHPSCLKVFPTQEEYQKHLKQGVHKLHVCDICGASLKHKYSLEVHLARHAGVTHFQCQYCSSSFHTKTELRNHVRSIHTTGLTCECKKCGSIFKNNKLLKQHLESHVEERNFKCKACDFAFKTQQHLKRHISTVHKEVRFNCDHCEMSYGRKDKLRMHVERAHNIQSYFICDICLRSFNSGSALKEHKGHHANPKPLECQVCLIAYENKTAFEDHLCISYQDDYVCCERDFKYHVHYNRHLLMEHGIKSNARVKPKAGLLMGQLRACRKQSVQCRKCKKPFRTLIEREKHSAVCKAEEAYSVAVSSADTISGQGPLQVSDMGEEEHLEEVQDDYEAMDNQTEYVINEEVEEEMDDEC